MPMKIICLIILLLLLGCAGSKGGSNSKKKNYSRSSRLIVERAGMGGKLESKLAALLLEGKRVQAMSICNDVLFSSRSTQDREIANYWRTILMALEEMEEGNYNKAYGIIQDGEKWWKKSSREYHSKLLIQLLMKIDENIQRVVDLKNKTNKRSSLEKIQYETMLQVSRKKQEELERKNKELEALIHELERIK